MPKPEPGIICVMLEADGLKVAQMVKQGPRLCLVAWASADLSPEEGADSHAISYLLRRLLIEAGIQGRRAVVSLPEAEVVVQLVRLPPLDRRELPQAVRSVAEGYAVFGDQEIAVDYLDLAQEREGRRASVLLGAARSSQVQAWTQAVMGAGLEVAGLEPRAVAAARSLSQEAASVPAIAAILMGGSRTEVQFFLSGSLQFSYTIEQGLTSLPLQEDLVRELDRCFRFLRGQFQQEAPDRALLCVDHTQGEEVAGCLGEALGLEVELRPIPSDLEAADPEALGRVTSQESLSLCVASGLALSQLSPRGLPMVNLATRALQARSLLLRLVPAGAVALFMLIASLALSWDLGLRVERQRSLLAVVEEERAWLLPQVTRISQQRSARRALEAQLERETARILGERGVWWSLVLADITRRLPSSVWLNSLSSAPDGSLSLAGTALGQQGAAALAQALSLSSHLSLVRLVSTRQQGQSRGRPLVQFLVKAEIGHGQGGGK